MANYFMPSEVARLILGYFIEKGLQRTLTTFLQECPDLAEFYRLMTTGRVPPITVVGQSLVDILNEFAELKLKAVRSGQLTIQPTNTVECSNTVARVIVQSREHAEKITQQKRISWRERKSRSRTKSTKAREDNTQTGVTGGAQDIANRSVSPSNEVSHPENISISTSSHTTDLGSTSIVTTAVTAADVVEVVPVATKNESHLLPQSAGAKADTGTAKEAEVAKPLPEPPVTIRRNEDENADFLDLLLGETQFHEKLAEHINKALLECGSSCAVGVDRVDDVVQQAGSSLDKDQLGKCAHIHNKDQASMVNRGFNINQIIQMTESDPSFQNFLQLFQQGTAIPISHFDVPVVTLSNELPSQPSCLSGSTTLCKETTSECTSLKGLPAGSAKCQDSHKIPTALPLSMPPPQSTDKSPPGITCNSLPKPVNDQDGPDSPNKCCVRFTKTSNNNSLSVSRLDHHNVSHSNKEDISICQENLSVSETSMFDKDKSKKVDVSSHQMKPFTGSNDCSVASQLHCVQFGVEDQASMEGKKSTATNSNELQMNCPQTSTLIPVCPDKETRQINSIILEDNSLTAFSLIEKSIAEMTGEKFVHRSLRNSSQSTSVDPPESSHCDNERAKRNNDSVSAKCIKTNLPLQETNIEIASVVSNATVCGSATEIVNSCEDNNAEKNLDEDNIKKNKILLEIKMVAVTNNSTKSVSPETDVSSVINAEVIFSETCCKKNVAASELNTHPDGCVEAPCLNADQVNTNCLSNTVHCENMATTDKRMQDLLPALSSQEKINDPSSSVNIKQCENRYPVGSLQQNHDRVEKDGHNFCSSQEKTCCGVPVMPIEKNSRQEGTNKFCHDRDDQAAGNSFHASTVFSPDDLGQNNPASKEPDSFPDVNSQKNEDNNSQVKNKGHNSAMRSFATGKEALHSRHCDPNSTFDTYCSAMRENTVENGLVIPEQTDNSAKHMIYIDLKRCNHGTEGISQMHETSNRFQSIFASKQPRARRSQSLSDFSFYKFHNGPHDQTTQNATKLFGPHGIVGSPPYCPMAAANSNSPQKLPTSRNSHNTCFSLPATFGSEAPCNAPFSQKLTNNPPLRHTQPKACTSRSPFQVSCSEESYPQNKLAKRKVIAIHSEHAPFIPDHCKKNPSRRIVPTEVDYSTPSPLQDFPSSPMNYVVDIHQSHISSPLREKERQLNVGKSMLSPSEHIKMSSQRRRTSSNHDTSNTLSRPQSKPCEEQLEENAPRVCLSQLEQLGIKLPPSPSRRKPRRVKPIQLSSAVDTGWSSLVRSSPCATQDRSSPFLDESKIVSSTSDVLASTEVEAFRMLKSFLASSYSKPQPRQEITSTDQATAVSTKEITSTDQETAISTKEITSTDQETAISTKVNLKHHKGRGRKNVASKVNLSEGHQEVNSESTSKRDVYTTNECVTQREAYCQVGTSLVNGKLRTDESRSLEERPGDDMCSVVDLPDKNCLGEDLCTGSLVPSTSSNSDDINKSFAAVGLMECYPKENDKQVQIIDKCRSTVQSSSSLPHIPTCESTSNISSIRKLKSQTCVKKDDTFSGSHSNLCQLKSKPGLFNILNKIIEGTEEDNSLGYKNCPQKSVAKERSSVSQLLSSHDDKMKSADNDEVHGESNHKTSSADKVTGIMADRSADTTDTTDEAEKVKPPTLAPVKIGIKNVPCACNSSCQTTMNSPCPSSLSEIPCSAVNTSAQKLFTQEEPTAVSKLNNSEHSLLHSCNEHQQKTSDSHENLVLINAPNLLSDIRFSTAVAVVNNSQSLVADKDMFTTLTVPSSVPIPDESFTCSRENNYLGPTFEDLNNSMSYVPTKPINKLTDGPYTALLNAPVTSSDVNLTGFLSSSLRLAYDIEHPSEMATSSLSSPAKHCSSRWGRQDIKGFDQSYCEGSNNVILRPGSPSSHSLLSTVMANCGIPFEGSNLTTPQTFIEQNHSIWQETRTPQNQTLDCSPSTSAQNNSKSRIGRKPQSRAQKPSYKEVSNILPRLGVPNWNAPEVAPEQPLAQSYKYSPILPKPIKIQDTVLTPKAIDSSTLLCQIQMIPSANGPVIIIPPGHEEALQKFLLECDATSSQRNLLQSSANSNLPIGNQCTPHDNMGTPQRYSSTSSLPISQENLPQSSANSNLPIGNQCTPHDNMGTPQRYSSKSSLPISQENLPQSSANSNLPIGNQCTPHDNMGTPQRYSSTSSLPISQENLPQSSANSNLPIGNQCTPHDNMGTPQRYSSKSSLPISYHPSLPCSDQKPPPVPQTDKLHCRVYVEPIDFKTGKESKENSFKNIYDLASKSAAGVNLQNENDNKQCNSSSKENEEQLTTASITKCQRKIAVRRRIDFTHLKISKNKNTKTNRLKVPESNVSDKIVSGAKQDYHDIVSSDADNEIKNLPSCSQSSSITLCGQNRESDVKQIENPAVPNVRADLKGKKISKRGEKNISSSEKKQMDDKKLTPVTNCVAKTSNRSKGYADDKDINGSLKNSRPKSIESRPKSIEGASILSELLRFKIPSKKINRKKNKINKEGKKQTKHLSSSTIPSPRTVKKAKKELSKTVIDSGKPKKDNTSLSTSTNDNKSSVSNRSSTPVVCSTLSNKRKRKLKQADQEEIKMDPIRPAKLRKLNKLNEEDQHQFSSKKRVRLVIDCSSGKAIEVGTLPDRSSDKCIVSKKEQLIEEPVLEKSKLQRKSENKSVWKKDGRTNDILACEKRYNGIDTEVEKLSNVKLVTCSGKSQKLDEVCKYIGSIPMQSLHSIFDLATTQGNTEAKKHSCMKIANKIQNRIPHPEHEESIRHSIASKAPDQATRTRRSRGAVSLKKVDKREKLLDTQGEKLLDTRAMQNKTENSETITCLNVDSVSAKISDNETESAVASLELCMREESHSDRFCNNTEFQHLRKKSSAINVEHPPIHLLQEKNVHPTHHLPISACSSIKHPHCYNMLEVSPMKSHLPPKKRLSSDFIMNGKADSQNQNGSNSQVTPAESPPPFVITRTECSSYVPSMLPSQKLQHPSTSVTTDADLRSVALQHVLLTPVNVTHSGHSYHLSNQDSSNQIDPQLPLTKSETPRNHVSTPSLKKTQLSATVLKEPLNEPLLCNSSKNNPLLADTTLGQLPSPNHSSINLQGEQRLSASPSPVISATQDSSTHGDNFLANDKQTLEPSSVVEHCQPANTVNFHPSPFTESKVHKLLKKLHKKKNK